MKRNFLIVLVCVIALLCPSFVLGQFGMGCCEYGMGWGAAGSTGMSCVTVGNVKVVPWLGFGYQSMGVNVNYPFSGTNAVFQNLDIGLKNNALWIGSLGLDVALRQRLRFFGAAGTNLFVSNAGSFSTGGFVGVLNPASSMDWSGTQLRWWELNLGGLYCLTDDVAILVGYKGDSLSEKLQRGGYGPASYLFYYQANEDYGGDCQIITRSPYVGIKVCQSHLDFSLVWSPWLTSYDIKIPLRVIDSIYGFGALAGSLAVDSRWQLSGGGGNLLEAFAQTKLNIREHLGVNLWLKGSWLQCRGNGNLDQSSLGSGFLAADMSASGSSSNSLFTRYLWALGISGQLMF